ncbi:hypothetical protein Q1695_009791 [Nippostrongylus brasiliensis]|nr:hypothetical protein Q1695_009791 [Nippostrongylus brasiliensis]
MILLQLASAFLFVDFSAGKKLADEVYYDIPMKDGEVGYRLLNGTHQFGFESPMSKSQGVIVAIDENMTGLHDCWRERFRGYEGMFHLFMPVDFLDRTTVPLILESKCVAGMILYPPAKFDEHKPLSHDASCPNTDTELYNSGCEASAWNEKGRILPEGLRSIDWNMQATYVYNETHIEMIKKCHDLFNVPSEGSVSVSPPFCAAMYGTYSRASGSSEICVRRSDSFVKYLNIISGYGDTPCGELVGVNLIAHLPPKVLNESSESEGPTKYLMLAARMDSFGLMPEVSPGEISVITSVIALLAVVQAIAKNQEAFTEAALTSNRYLLIAFFDGESFDFIGSSRAAYDMLQGKFPRAKKKKKLVEELEPINATQLECIVEVQQLADGVGSEIYAHVDAAQMDHSELKAVLASLTKGASTASGTIVPPSPGSHMPPSSWHSFARHFPSICGITLASFQESYEYVRINSMLDQVEWNPSKKEAAISEIKVAAAALLEAVTDHVRLNNIGNASNGTLAVDGDFIATLFACFMESPDWQSCEFLKTLTKGHDQSEGAYAGKSTYVKIGYRDRLRYSVQSISMYLLGTTNHSHSNVTDQHDCHQAAKHQNVYTYEVLTDPETNETHCYRTPVHITMADSPAFDIDDYDFASGSYSTWVESTYTFEDMHMYLMADCSVDWILLCIGLVLLIVSFLVVWRCDDDSMMDTGASSESGGETGNENGKDT